MSVQAGFVAYARGEWTMQPKLYVTNYPAGDFRAMLLSLIEHLKRLRQAQIQPYFSLGHVHNLEIVERLCTDIAIIAQGKLLASGSLNELRKGIRLERATATNAASGELGPPVVHPAAVVWCTRKSGSIGVAADRRGVQPGRPSSG